MKLGLHSLIYSTEPEELRAFLRDILELPCYDTGGGWLMFPNTNADLGIHPIDSKGGAHEISFSTDDLANAKVELEAKGAIFSRDIEDHGWGYVTYIKLPGAGDIMMYQPKYDRPQS